MTLKEAASYSRLDEKTLARLAQTGEIPARKLLAQWRFQKPAIDHWVATHATVPVTEQHLPPEATGLPALLTVASVINLARINLHLRATTRDEILHELVPLVIPPHERRLSSVLYEALKAREDLCSTCVNEGVAIPHSRNALVGVVDHATLAYGRHPVGAEFGALDGKPVHHFFLLCAPNVRDHLHLLSRLARLVNDAKFRQQLAAAAQPEDVTTLIRVTENSLLG